MSDKEIWNAHAEKTATLMAQAAREFLTGLTENQRKKALFPFKDDERYEWHYTPIDRNGLLLSEMTPRQADAAFRMMKTAYGTRSFREACSIIELETVLGEWEKMQGNISSWERNPKRYWFSIFGEPGTMDPWGFRVGGHHIGLSATVIEGSKVTVNPLFLGTNPAQIKHGERKGERILAAEEDLARQLLGMLSPDQKKIAIVDATAPADILTRNYRITHPQATPLGITFDELSDTQRVALVDLVRHYVTRSADELAANYWRRVEAGGLIGLSFGWAGSEKRSEGHYYTVQGRLFVIEYDNTQNNANHIHSVLRDFEDDWGEDLLAAHYKLEHR